MSVYADPQVRGPGARRRVRARKRREAEERQRLERLRYAGLSRPAPDPPVPSWYRAGHEELPRLVPEPVSVESLLRALLERELVEVG